DADALGLDDATRNALYTGSPNVPDHRIRETIQAALYAEYVAQANLLRDVFGPLPFRPVSVDDPTWRTPQVSALVHFIYDEAAFCWLPELADALEQAGCSKADVLAHCRGPGPHVRGCWVLDLLLDKE